LQEEVADKVGKDRASVANFLRLLRLPDGIQESLRQGRLAMGHAKALLGLDDPAKQTELADRIVKKGLSVREAEDLVSRRTKEPGPGRKGRRDPDLAAVEEELLKALGTKVVITGNAHKGAIRIFYFSMDELNRLFDIIKGAKT
jgi:ParB family chromosome partitioning protein